MGATFKLKDWRGPAIYKKMLGAQLFGVNAVMSEMVMDAKANHPGWKNITTNAEGSVKIVQHAHVDQGGVSGLWGSEGVDYVIWLELKHGAFLRTAFDNNKMNLHKRIKEKWQQSQT